MANLVGEIFHGIGAFLHFAHGPSHSIPQGSVTMPATDATSPPQKSFNSNLRVVSTAGDTGAAAGTIDPVTVTASRDVSGHTPLGSIERIVNRVESDPRVQAVEAAERHLHNTLGPLEYFIPAPIKTGLEVVVGLEAAFAANRHRHLRGLKAEHSSNPIPAATPPADRPPSAGDPQNNGSVVIPPTTGAKSDAVATNARFIQRPNSRSGTPTPV